MLASRRLSLRIGPASRMSALLRTMATEASGSKDAATKPDDVAPGQTKAVEPSGLVSFELKGTARVITLDRPKKLNALNTEMCNDIIPRLVEFNKSNSNNLVVLKTSSERAFCAGGDVVQAAKDCIAGEPGKAVEFFDKEYNLNYLLAVYGKPIVSLVNGIAMGGGVGLSVHAPFRVVCESTRIAMPETRIGFFNDVGTSFWLPRLDGHLGYYLSLTGDDLRGIDTLIGGYGTHYVPAARFDELLERLSELELSSEVKKELAINPDTFYSVVNEAIEEFTDDIPDTHKFKFDKAQLNTIDTCFNPRVHKSVISVIEALLLDGSDFAIETAKTLQAKSPISLDLNWTLLNKGSGSTIYEALQAELMTAAKLMTNYRPNDFVESIKTRLIEKKPEDEKPAYVYADLKAVPKGLAGDLTSNDIYNPEVPEGANAEQLVKDLDGLRISQYDDCPDLVQNYTRYPWEMGLPTEKEVGKYIKGEDDSNRQYSVTAKEAIKYFKLKYQNRNGVQYKINHILSRKTKPSEYGAEYLDWVD